MKYPLSSTLVLALAAGISASSAFASAAIDWVTIGDPGNAAQSAANRTHSFGTGGDGYGAVDYTYRIARDETTISQYTAFLNAVAASDPHGLYNLHMGSNANIAGISRSGSDGNYSYAVIGSGTRPITYVSWFDAARFSNWLHNGQQTGPGAAATTEFGAYTLNGATSGTIIKNVGATVWIPSENEWFKAAYYDPTHMNGAGGYWLHANQSDSMTSNMIGVPGASNHGSPVYAVTQSSSYSSSQNYLTDAGAYGPDSQSYYGLNDMAGNVGEWNDADSETSGGLRGGSWNNFHSEVVLRSSARAIIAPTGEGAYTGFRVASIPEPSAMILTMVFSAGLVARRKRRGFI